MGFLRWPLLPMVNSGALARFPVQKGLFQHRLSLEITSTIRWPQAWSMLNFKTLATDRDGVLRFLIPQSLDSMPLYSGTIKACAFQGWSHTCILLLMPADRKRKARNEPKPYAYFHCSQVYSSRFAFSTDFTPSTVDLPSL